MVWLAGMDGKAVGMVLLHKYEGQVQIPRD